ncbi:hypothetical protein [Burkholderia pseudomultivorans]|nr:hypothetical protein [Burkholderia pseudomultivorans]
MVRPVNGPVQAGEGTALKAIGTSLAGTALGLVTGGYQGAAPNPCARPGL